MNGQIEHVETYKGYTIEWYNCNGAKAKALMPDGEPVMRNGKRVVATHPSARVVRESICKFIDSLI